VSSGNAFPPARVPTLTEVIELSQTQPLEADESLEEVAGADAATEAVGADLPTGQEVDSRVQPPRSPAHVAVLPPISEEQLIQRVMAELQRQIDLMLEYRLREALAPLLSRAADSLVREARSELASTLRDVVARAVAQEIARHRTR
jgi:hypothetical protein